MNPDISNVVLWLSAATDEQYQTTEQLAGVEKFVRMLAREIYSQGGTIVHGMHPVISKWLVAELETIPEDRRRGTLKFVVSQFFLDSAPSPTLADKYAEIIPVIRIPAINKDRDASLKKMRHEISTLCNAFVAIGGKLHLEAKGRAGITMEIDFARNAGLPCYALGGFGGDAKRYIENNRLDNLRNGLSRTENAKLTESSIVDEAFSLTVEGLSRLPLEISARRLREGKSVWPGRFRILSFNGGGIKGAFSAAVLAAIENAYDCNIAEYFDLIAGTSTGGLIALGLGAGANAKRILELYRDKGAMIFPQGNCLWKAIRWFRSRKYAVNGLKSALSEILSSDGNYMCLKDSCCRLLVPSFSADDGEMRFFTTPHAEFCDLDGNVRMLDVALATSAAPTYFPPAEVRHGCSFGRYLDGGVGANMPDLMAVLHAVHYLGVLPSQIDVLSIGTTTVAKGYLRIPQGVKDWIFKGKIVDLYSNAQESFMENGRDMLLCPDQFLHIDSSVNGGDFSLDGLKNVALLISRGESAIREESVAARLRSKFINGVPADIWKAVRR